MGHGSYLGVVFPNNNTGIVAERRYCTHIYIYMVEHGEYVRVSEPFVLFAREHDLGPTRL